METIFRLIDKQQFSLIRELWEELNKIHYNDSVNFKNYFESFTFDQRIKAFESIEDKNIRIEIVQIKDEIIGYCISTITKETGDIQSLFVDSEYRSHGFGEKLVNNALAWFRSAGCNSYQVTVAEGHESVFGFYKKMGFYPRKTVLEYIN
ncbi:MAG: GNAT family N-acetyltransferase [Spirochaetes bacterium]|nr:GNAT family N-acetyltransferase [Spirochaetota bacterium]MBN2769090.1 GNAT family N-acetyltransferase [Spirochaetota bacterium]